MAVGADMDRKEAVGDKKSAIGVSKRSSNTTAICTGLTFRFQLDSTLPVPTWLAKNEADDSARCAVIDTAAIVACKCRANEHAPLEARVHREYT